MLNKAKRDTTIDALKGFAIILVVFGHSIQNNIQDYENNFIFKIIYSFHMPLFMLLGGYVAFLSLGNKSNWKIISNKFIQLIVPFLSWYFLVKFLLLGKYKEIGLFDFTLQLINRPGLGHWFLWILFLMFLILIPYRYLVKNQTNFIVEFIFFAFYVGIFQLFSFNTFGFNWVQWYLPFFLSGFYLAKYKNNLTLYKKYFKEVSFVLFPILLFFYSRGEYPSFIVNYISIFPGLFNLIYKYLIAFCGIGTLYFIVLQIKNVKIIKKIIWLGKYSLDVYLLDSFFVWAINDKFFGSVNGGVTIVVSVIITLILSFIISFYFLRQSKFLSFVFLGVKAK